MPHRSVHSITNYILYPHLSGLAGRIWRPWDSDCSGSITAACALPWLLCHRLAPWPFAWPVWRSFPGRWGVAVCVLWVVNWNTFILERSSILEHVLLFCCNVGLLAFSLGLLEDPYIAAGLGLLVGLILPVKWSFVIQAGVFVGMLMLGRGLWQSLAAFAVGTVIGCLVFGLAHVILLRQFGLWEDYIRNIMSVFSHHRGKASLCKYKVSTGGRWASVTYARSFFGWMLHCPPKKESWNFGDIALASALYLICLAGIFTSGGTGLGLYHAANFALFPFILLYLKRTAILFPHTLLLLGMGFYGIIERVGGGEILQGSAAWTALVALLALSMWRAWHAGEASGLLVDSELGRMAREVDEIVGEGQVIHAFGFAYRLFWQCRTRVRAHDEQFMGSQGDTVAWCLEENGRYVLLPESPAWPMPLELQALLRERWRGHVSLRISDPANDYVLYEIDPAYRFAAMQN